jgi:crotonobetainyl-CoA:carnitine CoA-transferase CaiB-like acyl-CoA transferase
MLAIRLESREDAAEFRELSSKKYSFVHLAHTLQLHPHKRRRSLSLEAHIPAHEALPLADLPVAPHGAGFDMLDGVKVLDLSTSVAGPYAAMLLGDMGADVVKIERHAGDDARAWGPPFLDGESLWFLSVNRNKRSMVLDYTGPDGLAVLHDLVARADVVVVNTPPRSARKLGIDAETLRSLNPRLVYASITGFGMSGPRADWPCYDLIAEGYSGVMDLTGEPDTAPQKVGAPAADLLAGQDAAFGALAALFRRHGSNSGATVDIAIVDSMTRFVGCRIVPYLGSGENPRRSGGRDSVIAIYQAFETLDDLITLGLGNDNIWQRFWAALGLPERAAEPRFGSNAKRRANRSEIVDEIQVILRKEPSAHWLKIFGDARIPAGPINQVADVVRDIELRQRGLFYALRQNDRTIPQVGLGIQFDGKPAFATKPPPALGGHSEEILREFAEYKDDAIAALKATKVI